MLIVRKDRRRYHVVLLLERLLNPVPNLGRHGREDVRGNVAMTVSNILHQQAGLLTVELDWLRCHCCRRIMIAVGTCGNMTVRVQGPWPSRRRQYSAADGRNKVVSDLSAEKFSRSGKPAREGLDYYAENASTPL